MCDYAAVANSKTKIRVSRFADDRVERGQGSFYCPHKESSCVTVCRAWISRFMHHLSMSPYTATFWIFLWLPHPPCGRPQTLYLREWDHAIRTVSQLPRCLCALLWLGLPLDASAHTDAAGKRAGGRDTCALVAREVAAITCSMESSPEQTRGK